MTAYFTQKRRLNLSRNAFWLQICLVFQEDQEKKSSHFSEFLLLTIRGLSTIKNLRFAGIYQQKITLNKNSIPRNVLQLFFRNFPLQVCFNSKCLAMFVDITDEIWNSCVVWCGVVHDLRTQRSAFSKYTIENRRPLLVE